MYNVSVSHLVSRSGWLYNAHDRGDIRREKSLASGKDLSLSPYFFALTLILTSSAWALMCRIEWQANTPDNMRVAYRRLLESFGKIRFICFLPVSRSFTGPNSQENCAHSKFKEKWSKFSTQWLFIFKAKPIFFRFECPEFQFLPNGLLPHETAKWNTVNEMRTERWWKNRKSIFRENDMQ